MNGSKSLNLIFKDMKRVFFLIWILMEVSTKVYSQSFQFVGKSPITDGKKETFSEFRSEDEIRLAINTKPEDYEGELDKIIISFRTDITHPLPKKISLKIHYEIERFSGENGEYNKIEVIFLDTILNVQEKKIIFQVPKFEEGFLEDWNLELSFFPSKNAKYIIEDIFIIGKNFRYKEVADEKPVIYLYPLQTTHVTIQHKNADKFTFSYPKYEKSWSFKVYTNGEIEDENGKRYPYLFWEGLSGLKTTFKMGYCVKKDSLVAFFEEKLAHQGLNHKEVTDFITYWVPRMQKFPYYLIYFANQEFDNEYPVEINQLPDTKLRVFMIAQPSEQKVTLKNQPLPKNARKGFVYVEWGGKLLE